MLEGKSAIVTGSGREEGIGRGIAISLAEHGCKVTISDIGDPKGERFSEDHVGTTDEMEAVVESVRSEGAESIAVPCDVRIETDVQNLISKTVEAFGRLDVFVNNAGVGYIMEPLTEFREESWDTVLDVNLKGMFLCTKHAARQMIVQNEGGRIINIASQAAKSGFPFAAAYTASKHGVIGLTRSNAVELGKHRITVNAICLIILPRDWDTGRISSSVTNSDCHMKTIFKELGIACRWAGWGWWKMSQSHSFSGVRPG